MSQILQIGPNKVMVVDRSWRDNGQDAQYAMQGGQRILIAAGAKPKPAIFQRGNEFFYNDGNPVTDPDHVSYLPEPFRSTALKFIQGDVKEKLPVYETKEQAAVAASVAPKKRGRPKKSEAKPQAKRIEIKDAASLVEQGGSNI